MRPELFKELEQEGKLPLRVNYCYTLFNLNDVASAVAYMGNDTERVRFVGGRSSSMGHSPEVRLGPPGKTS